MVKHYPMSNKPTTEFILYNSDNIKYPESANLQTLDWWLKRNEGE